MRDTARQACVVALAGAALWAAANGSPGAPPATRPSGAASADGPSDLGRRAAELAAKVLADPLDTPARERLEALRAQQHRETRSAYEALAQGLHAYMEAGPELAGPVLRQAARCPRAVSLVRTLGKPVRQMLRVPGAGPVAPAPAAKVCGKCGGTGEADCLARRCYGSGWVSCPSCKGRGLLQVTVAIGRQVLRICPDCAGTGVVRCEACGGRGTVACPACKRPAGRWAEGHLTPNEVKSIRQVVCRARWLSRGGIDLYTDGALKPPPK